MAWLKSQKENEQLYSIHTLDQAIKIDIVVSTKEREFSFLKMERLAGKTAPWVKVLATKHGDCEGQP